MYLFIVLFIVHFFALDYNPAAVMSYQNSPAAVKVVLSVLNILKIPQMLSFIDLQTGMFFHLVPNQA